MTVFALMLMSVTVSSSADKMIKTEVFVIISTVHTLAAVTKAGKSQMPLKIKPPANQLMNV